MLYVCGTICGWSLPVLNVPERLGLLDSEESIYRCVCGGAHDQEVERGRAEQTL